jgi:hypothetical protein
MRWNAGNNQISKIVDIVIVQFRREIWTGYGWELKPGI